MEDRGRKTEREGRGEGACSQSFSPSLGAALRPLELSLEPSKRRAASPLSLSLSLSLWLWRRVAIRLHRPTARRAAFASNAHQGVFFFFFFYSSSFSTSIPLLLLLFPLLLLLLLIPSPPLPFFPPSYRTEIFSFCPPALVWQQLT